MASWAQPLKDGQSPGDGRERNTRKLRTSESRSSNSRDSCRYLKTLDVQRKTNVSLMSLVDEVGDFLNDKS